MKHGFVKRLMIWVLLSAMTLGSLQTSFAQAAASPSIEEKAPAELLVCAAASLKDVMTEMSEAYKIAAPHVTLTYVYGSSGALQAQIEEGAPADLFLSAGKKQLNSLLEKGLLLNDSCIDLLENKIVLIVPKDSQKGLASFTDVAADKVTLVALGEPTGVPAGQYAKQIFESLGLWESVSKKTSFASDVRQVLTWVESGEVDCGVVYLTDAMTSNLNTVVTAAPQGSCDKIIYPAAVIKATSQPTEALAFLAYLKMPEAMAIFESYGFSTVAK